MAVEADTVDLSALRISSEKKDDPAGRGSKTRIIVVAILCAVLAAGYFFLRGSFAGVTEVEATTVTLTFASQANALLTASGYVVAQQKASVASKGTGRLVYLGVEEGDHVKKNQVIARLEDQDMIAALEKSTADLELAKADLDDARLALEMQKKLFASGLTSRMELEGASARYRRVQASIRSAEAAMQYADVGLENTRIRAPFDGTVLTKNADVGEVVAPFAASASSRAAVVSIADMSSLQVEADVSESNITRVKPGQPCEIVLDAYPGRRYQGVVYKVVPTADRAKATVQTKVRFTELDEKVLPEMSAKVTFLSKELSKTEANAAPTLTIPSSSVVSRNGRQIVFLIRDGNISETAVTTGERAGNRIEIKEGLQQGDQVVLRPGPELSTGSKVKVQS